MKNNAYLCSVKQQMFGYPGDIPAWGKPTPTLPNLKELSERQLFYFVYFFMKTR